METQNRQSLARLHYNRIIHRITEHGQTHLCRLGNEPEGGSLAAILHGLEPPINTVHIFEDTHHTLA